jgi:molecular chaperone GrpE
MFWEVKFMTEESKQKDMKEESVKDSENETIEEQLASDMQDSDEVKETDSISVAELQRQIEQLEREKEEMKNKYLRVQADYDNFRRRTKEEKAAASKYRAQNLAEKLLPAIDNFDRALNVKVEGEEAKSLIQGMEIVHRQLREAFEQENIKEIEAKGKPFDPEFHQAVMQVEAEDNEPNTVIEVMQKGYMLNDRVLRPAMVKVTQ